MAPFLPDSANLRLYFTMPEEINNIKNSIVHSLCSFEEILKDYNSQLKEYSKEQQENNQLNNEIVNEVLAEENYINQEQKQVAQEKDDLLIILQALQQEQDSLKSEIKEQNLKLERAKILVCKSLTKTTFDFGSRDVSGFATNSSTNKSKAFHIPANTLQPEEVQDQLWDIVKQVNQ